MASKHAPPTEVNIMLLGRNEVGKTSWWNKILGQSQSTPHTSTSQPNECKEKKMKQCDEPGRPLAGKTLNVINTPSLCSKNTVEMVERILNLPKTPHVLLFVVDHSMYRWADKYILEIFQRLYENAEEHTIVLFTNTTKADAEKFLQNKDNKSLTNFIEQGVEYQAFHDADETQVTELLQRIEKVFNKNKGRCCHSEKLEAVEDIIEEAIKSKKKPEAADQPISVESSLKWGLEKLEKQFPAVKKITDSLTDLVMKAMPKDDKP